MCKVTFNVLCEASKRDVKNDSSETTQEGYTWKPLEGISPFVVRNDYADENPSHPAARKADWLAFLMCSVYGIKQERCSIPISNVRLFTLAFLFDWACIVSWFAPCHIF